MVWWLAVGYMIYHVMDIGNVRMYGTINFIYYGAGKVMYHMACRCTRKSQEYVICVVHNTSHVRYCKCRMPCTRKSTCQMTCK